MTTACKVSPDPSDGPPRLTRQCKTAILPCCINLYIIPSILPLALEAKNICETLLYLMTFRDCPEVKSPVRGLRQWTQYRGSYDIGGGGQAANTFRRANVAWYLPSSAFWDWHQKLAFLPRLDAQDMVERERRGCGLNPR